MDGPFYVYALKDPRSSPAKPFYIGKGTGVRAWEHVTNVDSTRKGKRIKEILQVGHKVITIKLVDGLTELQALKLEAELISSFGTEDAGGVLPNSVIPTGSLTRADADIVIPLGCKQKAQIGLTMLKEAVLELALANPKGILNSDVAKGLALQSDYLGGSKDYLSWSVLGLLMREGRMQRVDHSRRHISMIS
jgi:hypothetical protein